MSQAVDTNVLVRFLTGDDPGQTALADAILREDFLLSSTVLMETEWVLRASYRWTRAMIGRAFAAVLDMPGLVGAPDGITWILDRYARSADFADIAHLAACAGADSFVTFDQRLSKAAGKSAPVKVRLIA